jgi:hypothetical protein
MFSVLNIATMTSSNALRQTWGFEALEKMHEPTADDDAVQVGMLLMRWCQVTNAGLM